MLPRTLHRVPDSAHRARRRYAALSLVLLAGLGLPAGCGESTMRLESDMKADLSGELATTVRLDGPVRIEMQGPIVRYEGLYVSEALFDRIDPGSTRRDWLMAVIGEPTDRGLLNDGSEIWKWTYRPVEQQGSFVELFSSSADEPRLQPSTTYVRIEGDTVVEAWRD